MTRTLSQIPHQQLRKLLRSDGVLLETGPFSFRIKSRLPVILDGLSRLYPDHVIRDSHDFADFNVQLDAPTLIRRFLRTKVDFSFDYNRPFAPLAPNQAYAFLEWGMNWCIAQYTNQFLKLHASVLEKNGRALIMPGDPGAGKSTLCAALMVRGWRLLSDEFALVSLVDNTLVPLTRPIGLKNESVDIIRQLDPGAVFGPPSEGTHKGTVVHLKPYQTSVARAQDSATPGWVVFPKYREAGDTRLTERLKETSFIKAASQSFNYSVLGQSGFESMGELIEQCDCYNLVYTDLDEAINVINELSEGAVNS